MDGCRSYLPMEIVDVDEAFSQINLQVEIQQERSCSSYLKPHGRSKIQRYALEYR